VIRHVFASRALLLALLVSTAPLAAQAQRPAGATASGTVAGTVLDAETGEPIISASVAVWAEERLVTGSITGPAGDFAIEGLRPGPYHVEVSFLGYEPQRFEDVTITPSESRVELGTVRLAPAAQALDGVEVAAEREAIQFQVDRTVYSARDNPVAESGSATDLLENLPSVEVDIEGNVSLRGNQNIAVQVNGRPVPVSGEFLASFLQQMPANAIDRIEVIPNPSAANDPDGMGGIINIVMREDAELGLSGGLTLTAGTADSYNASGNVAYQSGPLSVSGNYGFRYNTRESEGLNYRVNRFDGLPAFLDQTSTGTRLNTSHMFNASVDYRLAAQTTVGLSGMLSSRGGERDGLNAYIYTDAGRDFVSRYDRRSEGENTGMNADLTATFSHNFAPRTHTLAAELRFNRSENDSFTRYTEQNLTASGDPADPFPFRQIDEVDRVSNLGSFKVDYRRPILGEGVLDLGYKGDVRRLDNTFFAARFDYDIDDFVPETALNNVFQFDEQVHAAYGEVTHALGDLELKAGLRLEQAFTTFSLENTAESFGNDYFSAFPSAFLAYQITESGQLRASYSRRINRPGARVLNPFESIDDPLNRRRGNPFLQPEYTNSFEAGYTQFWRTGTATLTPYFRRTTGAIGRVKTIEPETGVSTVTFENFATRDSYGLEAIVSWRPLQWINGFVSFNGYRFVSDAGNVEAGYGADSFTWTTRANASFALPQGLDLQLSGFYRAPMDTETGRISSVSRTELSVRKRLLDDRASLTFRVADVFDTMGFNFTVDEQLFYQEASRKWQSRVAMLTFSYTFGEQQRRQRGDRQRGQEGGEGDGDFEVAID
jgi:outer membrane receptor protein involved in Fe transport